MQYKCVPVPESVVIDKKTSHADAVRQYEAIINEQASEGWRYVTTDSITSLKPAGCLASLLGQPAQIVHLKMIVFVKEPH